MGGGQKVKFQFFFGAKASKGDLGEIKSWAWLPKFLGLLLGSALLSSPRHKYRILTCISPQTGEGSSKDSQTKAFLTNQSS